VVYSSLSELSCSALIRRVKERDAEAWVRLAQLYTPLVYRWTRQCGLQEQDAADIAQEVFRAVADNIQNFRNDGPGATFRGWLWTVTRNTVRLHFRKQARTPDAMGGSAAQQGWEQMPEFVEQETEPEGFDARTALLHRALQLIRDEFEPGTWAAFYRMTIEGHATTEIADDLGMSTGAVRQAKYRVLCRLREMLDDSP
jgi:RNA polymerase sigma-70 factor, ECF subfamily